MDRHICIDKTIHYKEWYGDPIVMCVYIHLLIHATDATTFNNNGVLRAGQLITSYRELLKLKISISQARYAIKRLVESDDVTIEKIGRRLLISINGYALIINP